MAFAVITVDFREMAVLQRKIDRLIGLVGDELPEAIGAHLERSASERIEGGRHLAPDGSPWPEWSDAYADSGRAGQNQLELSGALREAIQHEHTAHTVIVYAAMEYASVHQDGIDEEVTVKAHTRRDGSQVRSHSRQMHIPARPYLGMSDQDVRDIENLVDGMAAEVFG